MQDQRPSTPGRTSIHLEHPLSRVSWEQAILLTTTGSTKEYLENRNKCVLQGFHLPDRRDKDQWHKTKTLSASVQSPDPLEIRAASVGKGDIETQKTKSVIGQILKKKKKVVCTELMQGKEVHLRRNSRPRLSSKVFSCDYKAPCIPEETKGLRTTSRGLQIDSS